MDMEWSHNNIKEMYEDYEKLNKYEKYNDVIYSLGLFKVVIFSLVEWFLELTIEVVDHLDFEHRILKDYMSKIIIDIFPQGIEDTFNWSN